MGRPQTQQCFPNACIRHCGEQPYTFAQWTRRWVQGYAAVAAADVTGPGSTEALRFLRALITGTSQKIQALGLQSYRATGKIRSDCIEGKLRQRKVIDLEREPLGGTMAGLGQSI